MVMTAWGTCRSISLVVTALSTLLLVLWSVLENFGRGVLNVLDSQSYDVCSLQSVFVKVKPQYMHLHCVSLVATVLL